MRKKTIQALLNATYAALTRALADLLRVSNMKFWRLPAFLSGM